MQFHLERPDISHRERAINYVNEFTEYNSEINGDGGLDQYLDNYEGWLQRLEEVRNTPVSENLVPGETFFLVNELNDIIGCINIRYELNDQLRAFGGHIGYSIRPTERGNGYNNINLYLALEECQRHGIEEVLLDCCVTNLGSDATIRRLGGNLLYTGIDPYDNELTNVYSINVNESLENNVEFRQHR